MSLVTFIVDDDPLVCFIHKKILKGLELMPKPVIFGNGQAALDYLLEHYQEDQEYLIFLDINMPLMNGFDLLREMKIHFSADNIGVIIVSSSIRKEDRQTAGMHKNVLGYLEKPIKRENLPQISELVDKWKEGGR
jgi:CheY-like chemotaxis protein